MTRWTHFRTGSGRRHELVDYRETDLSGFDAVVLPGGFSYGDYLRCGAIARFAPVMEPMRAFAERGGPVLGICNGFQVLIEAHLLPGALLKNRSSSHFICDWVKLRVETGETAWTGDTERGRDLRLPVAHGVGNYFADPATLERIEGNGQVVFRYSDEDGEVDRVGQFQWLGQRDRRHLQRTPQCCRPDAASRARIRSLAGSN